MNFDILDYAVYRDRQGRLDTMPIRAQWDDARVYRQLQERVNYYTGPIEWLRVSGAATPEDAIEQAFVQMERRYTDEIREALKAVPPSERTQAARQIIIEGRPVQREGRSVHRTSGWHPAIPREYAASCYVRQDAR
jgi:hypothetical protein